MHRSSGGTAPWIRRPYRGYIVIFDRADIRVRELYKRLCIPGCANEFHLDRVWRVNVDDGAEITLPKSIFRKVSLEDNAIELVDIHRLGPGYAVTTRGGAPLKGTTQTVTTGRACPQGL